MGSTGVLSHGHREIESAFVKTPISGPVDIGPLGFPAMSTSMSITADRTWRCSPTPLSITTHWRSLGLDLPEAGAMAENLTVAGLIETDDVHRRCDRLRNEARDPGDQPRSPCFKLAAHFQRRSLPVKRCRPRVHRLLLGCSLRGRGGGRRRLEIVERATESMTVERAGRHPERRPQRPRRRPGAARRRSPWFRTRRTFEARVAAGGFAGEDSSRLYLDDGL